MAKQTFTTGQVLTAAQVNSLQTNDFNQTVSAKTASYVLVASDKGTRIEFNTSGSVTCTVNTGIFDAGDTLIVQNRGAGAVTITAGTATVNTSGSLVVNQYESGTLYFISASAALWFGSNPGDITGITTGASSGLTGGVTSGTADLKFNTTAKGALLVGTGAGTVTELTVGSNNTVLTADSATASGLKWATPSSTPTFVGCIAYGAVNLSFGTTATVLSSLTTEIIDTHGFHSTTVNTERMTIPSGYGGTYLINLDTNLASTASMQNIYLRLRKNGTNVTEGLTNGNLATNLTGSPQDGHFNVSMIVTAVAGDYFDFTLQTGGSSSTTDKVRYSIAYLGA